MKKPVITEITGFFAGAPAGIRTPDTLLKRQVLCLLSYWGACIRTSAASALLWVGGSRESFFNGWDGGTRTHYIGVKVRCVTITLHPSIINRDRRSRPLIIFYMGWDMGLEPTTPGTTIRCSTN